MESAWVFRIARNIRLDHWRTQGRAPRSEPLQGDDLVAPAARVDGLALDEALERLGDAEREAFVLREVAGLGYAEIADATGATPDAVRNRIHRARMALRQALGPGDGATRASVGREARRWIRT